MLSSESNIYNTMDFNLCHVNPLVSVEADSKAAGQISHVECVCLCMCVGVHVILRS